MQALTLGLMIVAALLTLQRLLLRGYGRIARLKRQAYEFHAIRDALQLYAVEGVIDTASDTYGFVMWLSNFSIRNAGSMKFSTFVSTAAELEETVEHRLSLFDDIKSQDERVRQLAAECFVRFGHLLISNDPVVRVLAAARRIALHSGRLCGPLVRLSDNLTEGLAGHSMRARAVSAARRYIGWGHDLAPA